MKDGHLFYGPYNNTNVIWNWQDTDVCNGRVMGIDGEYGYVATNYHPYTIGCFGPGN